MFTFIIKLIRVKQWYKNLVVFLPIFFASELLNVNLLISILIGFVSLCLTSSAGYVINDFIDLKKDQLNPEKKNRPLASGKVSKTIAILLIALLLCSSLILSYYLGLYFFIAVLSMFVLGQIYSLWLKNVLFADIITIAILFVIRAVSGAFIINVSVSPWLILCPFFLSLFLSVGKRHSEVLLMKDKAGETRQVLKYYNAELTTPLMIISTTLLIISYALYSFLSEHNFLLITLPFALFVVFRFFYFINSNSEIARHPEKVVKDLPLMLGMLLWVIVAFFLIYLPNFFL
jgi:4-hydroxybenzoate polyprenyltransferase